MQTESLRSLSEMSNDIPPVDLRRSVAMHRAAQVLADATLCRRGDPPLPLNRMDPHEREWFKQAAKNVIEIYEHLTTGRESDDVADATSRAEQKLASAIRERLSQERSRARLAAAERGHDLSAWAPQALPGIEASRCRRCSRAVVITLGNDPVLSGSALAEGCLTATEGA
jgi:hypothetical protein